MNEQQGGGESPTAPEWFDTALHWIALAIEAAGVAAMVLGSLVAFALLALYLFRGREWDEIYHIFRTSLARSILLGLEFLVAADIIRTVVVEPTLQNVYVLALIVLIRTFLSFALEVEIEGRWPWQKDPKSDKTPGSP